jgi:hypothetical protein
MGFSLAMFAEIMGFILAMFAELNGLNFGYVCRDKWALFWSCLQR